MGLLNKLKNVLFEETEIDEQEVEEVNEQKLDEKIEKATMNLPKIDRKKKEEKKSINEYKYDDEPDSELFKIEKTFDFPAFDEEEFEDFIPRKKEVQKPKKIEEKKEEKLEKDIRRNRAEAGPSKIKKEYSSTRIIRTTRDEPIKKAFKPSPVISPVYGILDKNYKKEDVLTRDEKLEKENVKLDVDSVRKKAFGALEEDFVNNSVEEEPIIKFYEDVDDVVESEQLDELEDNIEDTILESSNIEEIDVTKEMEIPTDTIEDSLEEKSDDIEKKDVDNTDEDILYEEAEDEIDELFDETEDKIEIEEEKIEKPKKNKRKKEDLEEIIDEKIEEEYIEEDDDEDDLFDLIDSMYENKEDE